MNKIVDEIKNIDSEFFEIDSEKKEVNMVLEYQKPSDIFDQNAITKIPMLSDDFISWLQESFEYAPRNHKINLDITFDDLEGYTEEELQTILRKNFVLEAHRVLKATSLKNNIAFLLIGIGVLAFIAMLVITNLWIDDTLAKQIFSYISDIAVTVTFWEAMTILIVENAEKTNYYKNLAKGYNKITFHKKHDK